MPILASPQHEQFAQGLANRLKQVDAYEAAGYPRSPSSASQLAAREEVRNRVTEIIAERQASAEQREKDDPNQPVEHFDRDWATKMLQRNITLAQSGGQISAANKAIEILLDLHGMTGKKKPGEEEADDKPSEPAIGDLAKVMQGLEHLIPPKGDGA